MSVYKCAGKVHKCYIFAGRDDLSRYEKSSRYCSIHSTPIIINYYPIYFIETII